MANIHTPNNGFCACGRHLEPAQEFNVNSSFLGENRNVRDYIVSQIRLTQKSRPEARTGDEKTGSTVLRPEDENRGREFVLKRAMGRKLSEVRQMLRKIEGTVETYKPINVRNVQVEIEGSSNVIDLNLDQPWVLKNGDHIIVAGEDDGRTGTFNGYAYWNDTKEVFGKSDPGLAHGWFYILMGIIFSWAIFPLFTHLPAGVKQLAFGRKVDQAASML